MGLLEAEEGAMRDPTKGRSAPRRWNAAPLIAAALAAIATLSCGRDAEEPQSEPGRLWSTLKEKATDVVVEKAIDQAEGLLQTLNEEDAPVLHEGGFDVSEVRLSIGVPPGLALRVRRLETVSEARQEELLEEHGDDETLAAILGALFALSRFEAEGYELKEIMVHSDLPPRVTLILAPDPRA